MNAQTKALRKLGQSLKFHRGVAFTKRSGSGKDANPELSIVEFALAPCASRRTKPYRAPTGKGHPILAARSVALKQRGMS